MKKPFKETKGFGILKAVVNGAIEVTPFTAIKDLFDKDKDGKLTAKDFAQVEWWKIIGAIAAVSAMVHYDIISIDVFKELIMMFLE